MRYKVLGKSGLKVSELSLGTMTFGEDWGWGANYDESKKVFDAYVNAGGNFIDTACNYTNGTSEKFVGDFIQGNRNRFVVATKFTLSQSPTDVNGGGNHRKNLIQSVESSLKRLKTDYIDLLWVHVWDKVTPVQEVMRGLDDLIRAGKVLYIGISDAPAWYVAQANTLSDLKGWSSFIGLQIKYSLLDRTPERDLIPMAKAFGITVTPWAPLGGGVLTGKYANRDKFDTFRYTDDAWAKAILTPRNLKVADVVESVSKKLGVTSAQVAMAWLRQKEPTCVPIYGVRSQAQQVDILDCLNIVLDEAAMNELDEASKVELGFPHDFIDASMVKSLIYGETYSKIDF